MMSEPVEGIVVELEDESNLFEWKVYIEGPPDTPYEGGVFQLLLKFTNDFPMSPPELRFVSDFWHPNVYKDTGVVCISILHPPGEDEMSGELPGERWMPTQTVTTILLSVMSLLSAPNFSSPANVDASVEWQKDSEGFRKKCQQLASKALKEKPTHIIIPHPDTNEEERAKQVAKFKELSKPIDMDDFMEYSDGYEEEEDEHASNPSEEVSESEKETKSNEGDPKKGKTRQNSEKGSKSHKKTTTAEQKKKIHEGAEGKISTRRKKKKCTVM